MSTRATYEIDGTTFYIHHDGYPTGAASYFMAALQYIVDDKPRAINSGFKDVFMRANDNAEITRSHEAHGDTDYRYTIATDNEWHTMRGHGVDVLSIKVESVGWSECPGKTLFEGPLADFIAQASKVEEQS